MAVRLRSVVGVLVFIIGCAWPLACGGKSPASSSGTPTPVAVNTATPIPTPSPSPFPGVGGCGLPASGPGVCHERGAEDVGVFQAQVDETTLEVVAQHPEYFASDGAITHYGAFRVAMIAGLEARGLCAVIDGEEIAIKNDNGFSEQWKVELSNGRLRIGKFAYRAVCRPANFPIDPTPLPQRGDCSLPSSFSYACSRLPESLFLNDVEKAMDAVIAERPDLTDGQTVAMEHWEAFYQATIDKLRAKGFCAIFDGEELAVKADNERSEQFHPILSSTTLRRGFGNYRATCEPAAY
jgi:hypothetical protein